MGNERLLTPAEAAELLCVSKPTIYRWVHLGYIPHHKLGGSVRFCRKSIETWLQERETAGRSSLWIKD